MIRRRSVVALAAALALVFPPVALSAPSHNIMAYPGAAALIAAIQSGFLPLGPVPIAAYGVLLQVVSGDLTGNYAQNGDVEGMAPAEGDPDDPGIHPSPVPWPTGHDGVSGTRHLDNK